MIKDPKNQNCTKHIIVIYHYIQSLIEKEKLGIKWLISLLMLPNGLIKDLFIRFFKMDHDKWGLVD